jgi:uncharacterized protein (DUF3084 family)
MPSVEERLAAVEAQVQDHTHALSDVRDAIQHLEQRMDARFDAIDQRFEANDRRFEALERRVDRLDDKVSRQFMWTVGIQITVLLAVVSAFAAMMGIVLSRV